MPLNPSAANPYEAPQTITTPAPPPDPGRWCRWVGRTFQVVSGLIALAALFMLIAFLKVLLEIVLLVVREHDHKGDIKDILQPFREGHGGGMSQVEAVRAWAAPCVEVEGLALLVEVEDRLKVSMTKHNSPAQVSVRLDACDLFEPFEEGLVDALGPELIDLC